MSAKNQYDASNHQNHKHDAVINSTLCCLELLYQFREYNVEVPASPLKENSKKNSDKLDSSKETKILPLRIHIGLSLGGTLHVMLGKAGDDDSTRLGRAEYFVAGNNLDIAGYNLGKSESGQMVVSFDFWDILIKNLPLSKRKEWDFSHSTASKKKYKIIASKDNDTVKIDVHESNVVNFIDLLKDNASIPNPMDSENYVQPQTSDLKSKFSLWYVEESLSLEIIQSRHNDTRKITPMQYKTSNSDYNQLRKIATVFIRFPKLVYALGDCQLAQEVYECIIKIARMYGGTLRQFNCDDKGSSALIVWGMQGYAHEKGESVHAVRAGIEMSSKLETIIGSDFSIGISSGTVYETNCIFFFCALS